MNILMNIPMVSLVIIVGIVVTYIIELDHGKCLTEKPDQFDGKNPWVSCNFSLKPIHW